MLHMAHWVYHRLITMMFGMLINSIAVPLKVRDLWFCSMHGARGSCFGDSDTKRLRNVASGINENWCISNF